MTKTKILYLISSGHSGSTILGNAVGALDGFFHAGELRLIWRNGLLNGSRCGCGRELTECEIWSSVLERVAAEAPTADPHTVLALNREALRVHNTGRLLRLTSLPSGWKALDAAAAVQRALYGAIAGVTGARVVVDTTKREDNAALLRLLPDVDPYLIHLVRDPRAVAHSWNRRRARLERTGTLPRPSARGWVARNHAAELIRRWLPRDRSLLVRYEDFVAKPRDVLLRISALVGEEPSSLPISGEHTLVLGTNHTAGGNRARFRAGPVELREDVEWRSRLGRVERLLTTVVTLPMLPKYGYPVRSSTDGRPAAADRSAGGSGSVPPRARTRSRRKR